MQLNGAAGLLADLAAHATSTPVWLQALLAAFFGLKLVRELLREFRTMVDWWNTRPLRH